MKTTTEAARKTESERSLSAKDLCYIAVFTAIIAVMAQISIPMPAGVPMTLQTLAIPLAGLVLGAKRGTLSALLYVLLGAVGVPVFAGFTGGLGIVLGVTGGFIITFPLMALAAGLFADRDRVWILFGLIIGAVVNYAAGTVWFMISAGSPLSAALSACVLPFIPTAGIKIILAAWLGPVLRRALKKAGLI